MTFTDPHQPITSASEDGPVPKPRARQRAARSVPAPSPIQTRLAPNCAWPSESDALPSRRAKRR